jgi:hypothetical protein
MKAASRELGRSLFDILVDDIKRQRILTAPKVLSGYVGGSSASNLTLGKEAIQTFDLQDDLNLLAPCFVILLAAKLLVRSQFSASEGHRRSGNSLHGDDDGDPISSKSCGKKKICCC